MKLDRIIKDRGEHGRAIVIPFLPIPTRFTGLDIISPFKYVSGEAWYLRNKDGNWEFDHLKWEEVTEAWVLGGFRTVGFEPCEQPEGFELELLP